MEHAYHCPTDLGDLILTLPDIDKLHYDRVRCGGRAGARLKKLRDKILIDHDPAKYKIPFTGWNLTARPVIDAAREQAGNGLPITYVVKWVLENPRKFGMGSFNFMLFHFERWGFIDGETHIKSRRTW